MKFSIALLALFLVGSLGLGAPFAPAAPIATVVQKSYGLQYSQLSDMCPHSLFMDIVSLNSDSSQTTFDVGMAIFDNARKKSNVVEEDWTKWIKEKCFSNHILKTVSKSVIDKLQACVGEKKQLNGKKKQEAQDYLFQLICQDVKAVAQVDYYPLVAKQPGHPNKS